MKRLIGMIILCVMAGIPLCFLQNHLVKAQAQTKDIATDKKPAAVTPFTIEESYVLTDSEKTKLAQDRIIDELNDKLAVAVFTRKAAINQFNEIAAKYPGEVFTKSKNGLYEGHRPPTEAEKGK